MEKMTITPEEHLQLLAYEELGRKHARIVAECEEAMSAIVQQSSNDSGASEVMYGDRDVAWFLEANKFTVAQTAQEVA